MAEGNNPPDLRKQRRAGLAGGTAQRCADPPHLVEGSFEEIARRWFVLRKDDWIETYSTKVLRRLERHVFPYIGEVVKLVAVPHAVPNHLVAQESLQGFKHLVRGLGSVAEHGHLDLGRA